MSIDGHGEMIPETGRPGRERDVLGRLRAAAVVAVAAGAAGSCRPMMATSWRSLRSGAFATGTNDARPERRPGRRPTPTSGAHRLSGTDLLQRQRQPLDPQ
jgi:hypothetical protein